MTKKDLVEVLTAKKFFETKVGAERVVNEIIETISATLAEGEAVELFGFGKFEVTLRPERTCRNPKTGEEMVSPEKNVVKFKPAKALKDRV